MAAKGALGYQPYNAGFTGTDPVDAILLHSELLFLGLRVVHSLYPSTIEDISR